MAGPKLRTISNSKPTKFYVDARSKLSQNGYEAPHVVLAVLHGQEGVGKDIIDCQRHTTFHSPLLYLQY